MIIHVHVCVHLGQVETQISKNIKLMLLMYRGGGGDFESPILVGHHFGLHLDHILTTEEVA